MSPTVNTVAILGLGLIGGSLARALRENGFCERLLGFGHREPSLRRGVELGVIDDFTLDLDEVIRQADILVLCAPTLVAAETLSDIVQRLAGADKPPLVTDAASVKGNLLAAAQAANGGNMPPNVVLGHPIAGAERSGVDASRADLFDRHRVILTPVEGNDREAVATIRAMWECTGAEVVEMSVKDHDRVLAATSHLPHALAYALVDSLAQSESGEEVFKFAAGGFRDFTRIASSDPLMWRDISIANKDALLDSIDQFSAHLAQLRTAVEDSDADSLQDTFSRAKEARDHFAAILAARAQKADS